jgi:hypothetical protein
MNDGSSYWPRFAIYPSAHQPGRTAPQQFPEDHGRRSDGYQNQSFGSSRRQIDDMRRRVMGMWRRTLVGATLAAFTTTVLQAQTDMSLEAHSYLDGALAIMEQNSLNKGKVNWADLRAKTFAHAAGAESSEDTYQAIRFALFSLNDHHSFLQLSSDALQAKDKAARERRHDAFAPASGAAQPEKWPPSPYIGRREPAGDMVTVDGVSVGRLVVPIFEGQDDAAMRGYATALQSAIVRLAKQNPAGWIVDLRGNLGGNMWPMLAGVGSLEGFGPVGSITYGDGHKEVWFNTPAGVGMTDAKGQLKLIMASAQPKISKAMRPVAVIFDHGTASSGEAIAVSFRGRRLSRSFGRPTHGQTTANQGFLLPDGANIVLATAMEEDRTGRVYPAGLTPDVELPEESNLSAAGTVDPMTRAATAWIREARGR